MKNYLLIGMPGAGKSTIGVVLAKMRGFNFVDADLLIQEKFGMLLQDIVNRFGIEEFKKIENDILCSINKTHLVIATGGSAVYCHEGMLHLKKNSLTIYLSLDLEAVKKRITNINTRGLVMKSGDSIDDLYIERKELYEKYSDHTIDCNNLDIQQIIELIPAI